MHSSFYIDLSFKTPEGPKLYARFLIGNNREQAHDLFDGLTGTADSNDRDMLYVELIEVHHGLPLTLKTITCTLDEVTVNCRTITKKLFTRPE